MLKDKILPGGMILVEVPHAKDFLLSTLNNEDFKNFSLWSQHLILHTRESLHKMLDYAGFKKIQIARIPLRGSGIAINDRIKRAAYKK